MVPSLSLIWLSVTLRTAAHQAPLSLTESQSLLKTFLFVWVERHLLNIVYTEKQLSETTEEACQLRRCSEIPLFSTVWVKSGKMLVSIKCRCPAPAVHNGLNACVPESIGCNLTVAWWYLALGLRVIRSRNSMHRLCTLTRTWQPPPHYMKAQQEDSPLWTSKRVLSKN